MSKIEKSKTTVLYIFILTSVKKYKSICGCENDNVYFAFSDYNFVCANNYIF